MPYYDFRDTKTGEIFEDVFMKMSEREQYLKDNPYLEQSITKVNITDPIRSGVTKRHGGLTEKLKAIKKAHKGSTIDV